MAWHWESTCSACALVSRQLGAGTPCPWHAGLGSARVSEERSGPASPLPSADCPWPFSLRQYARLLLLRARLRQEHPWVPFEAASEDRLPARWTDEERVELNRPHLPRAAGGEPAAWGCPDWLRPYLGLVTGVGGELVQELVNDCAADAEAADPARGRRIDLVRAQVRLLETLHAQGLLGPRADGGR